MQAIRPTHSQTSIQKDKGPWGSQKKPERGERWGREIIWGKGKSVGLYILYGKTVWTSPIWIYAAHARVRTVNNYINLYNVRDINHNWPTCFTFHINRPITCTLYRLLQVHINNVRNELLQIFMMNNYVL